MNRRLCLFFTVVMTLVQLGGTVPVMAEHTIAQEQLLAQEQSVSDDSLCEDISGDDGYTATFKLSDDHLFQEGYTGLTEDEVESAEDEIAAAAQEEGFIEAELIDYLHDKMAAGETGIDLSGYRIPYEVFQEIADKAINLNPDLFNVTDRYCSYDLASGYVKTMEVRYSTMSDSKYKAAVKKALACTNSSMTKIEKVIAIHDYLALNCEYDYENYKKRTIPSVSYTAYGCLVKKKCVCMGYALAFNDLMKELDIDAYYVSSESMNHAWSMVKIAGNYYHVDVTWDDPVADMFGRVRHKYILLSDDGISDHHGWTVYSDSGSEKYRARDAKYDGAVWQTSYSPVILQDGYCYYMGADGTGSHSYYGNRGLCRVTRDDYAGGEGELLYPVNYDYSGLFKLNNRFFFSSVSEVISVKQDASDPRVEMEADDGIDIIGYVNGKAKYINQRGELKDLHLSSIPPTHVTMSTTDIGIAVGADKELSVTTYPAYAGNSTVLWESDDDTIAAVYGNTLTGISPGTTQISAKCVWEDGTEVSSSMIVTVFEAEKYSDGLWMEDIPDSVVYPGKAVKFSNLEVYYGATRLVQGKEYTVSYHNNKAVGSGDDEPWTCAPTVRVRGKGKYAGTIMRTFTIEPKSISDNDIACDDIVSAYKAGKKYKAKPKLYFGNAVVKASNYDIIDAATGIAPEKYEEPGVYTLKLKGKGNYTGSRTIRFWLAEDVTSVEAEKRIPLKGFKIESIEPVIYDGEEHAPEITVTGKTSETLEEGRDYYVTCSNNINAGKATIAAHGIGAYRGTLTKKFVIKPYDIAEDESGLVRALAQEHNAVRIVGGKATPKALVYFRGEKLRYGVDYTIGYSGNKKVRDKDDENPPTLIIKGKKNFKNKIRIPFSTTTMGLKRY